MSFNNSTKAKHYKPGTVWRKSISSIRKNSNRSSSVITIYRAPCPTPLQESEIYFTSDLPSRNETTRNTTGESQRSAAESMGDTTHASELYLSETTEAPSRPSIKNTSPVPSFNAVEQAWQANDPKVAIALPELKFPLKISLPELRLPCNLNLPELACPNMEAVKDLTNWIYPQPEKSKFKWARRRKITKKNIRKSTEDAKRKFMRCYDACRKHTKGDRFKAKLKSSGSSIKITASTFFEKLSAQAQKVAAKKRSWKKKGSQTSVQRKLESREPVAKPKTSKQSIRQNKALKKPTSKKQLSKTSVHEIKKFRKPKKTESERTLKDNISIKSILSKQKESKVKKKQPKKGSVTSNLETTLKRRDSKTKICKKEIPQKRYSKISIGRFRKEKVPEKSDSATSQLIKMTSSIISLLQRQVSQTISSGKRILNENYSRTIVSGKRILHEQVPKMRKVMKRTLSFSESQKSRSSMKTPKRLSTFSKSSIKKKSTKPLPSLSKLSIKQKSGKPIPKLSKSSFKNKSGKPIPNVSTTSLQKKSKPVPSMSRTSIKKKSQKPVPSVPVSRNTNKFKAFRRRICKIRRIKSSSSEKVTDKSTKTISRKYLSKTKVSKIKGFRRQKSPEKIPEKSPEICPEKSDSNSSLKLVKITSSIKSFLEKKGSKTVVAEKRYLAERIPKAKKKLKESSCPSESRKNTASIKEIPPKPLPSTTVTQKKSQSSQTNVPEQESKTTADKSTCTDDTHRKPIKRTKRKRLNNMREILSSSKCQKKIHKNIFETSVKLKPRKKEECKSFRRVVFPRKTFSQEQVTITQEDIPLTPMPKNIAVDCEAEEYTPFSKSLRRRYPVKKVSPTDLPRTKAIKKKISLEECLSFSDMPQKKHCTRKISSDLPKIEESSIRKIRQKESVTVTKPERKIRKKDSVSVTKPERKIRQKESVSVTKPERKIRQKEFVTLRKPEKKIEQKESVTLTKPERKIEQKESITVAKPERKIRHKESAPETNLPERRIKQKDSVTVTNMPEGKGQLIKVSIKPKKRSRFKIFRKRMFKKKTRLSNEVSSSTTSEESLPQVSRQKKKMKKRPKKKKVKQRSLSDKSDTSELGTSDLEKKLRKLLGRRSPEKDKLKEAVSSETESKSSTLKSSEPEKTKETLKEVIAATAETGESEFSESGISEIKKELYKKIKTKNQKKKLSESETLELEKTIYKIFKKEIPKKKKVEDLTVSELEKPITRIMEKLRQMSIIAIPASDKSELSDEKIAASKKIKKQRMKKSASPPDTSESDMSEPGTTDLEEAITKIIKKRISKKEKLRDTVATGETGESELSEPGVSEAGTSEPVTSEPGTSEPLSSEPGTSDLERAISKIYQKVKQMEKGDAPETGTSELSEPMPSEPEEEKPFKPKVTFSRNMRIGHLLKKIRDSDVGSSFSDIPLSPKTDELSGTENTSTTGTDITGSATNTGTDTASSINETLKERKTEDPTFYASTVPELNLDGKQNITGILPAQQGMAVGVKENIHLERRFNDAKPLTVNWVKETGVKPFSGSIFANQEATVLRLAQPKSMSRSELIAKEMKVMPTLPTTDIEKSGSSVKRRRKKKKKKKRKKKRCKKVEKEVCDLRCQVPPELLQFRFNGPFKCLMLNDEGDFIRLPELITTFLRLAFIALGPIVTILWYYGLSLPKSNRVISYHIYFCVIGYYLFIPVAYLLNNNFNFSKAIFKPKQRKWPYFLLKTSGLFLGLIGTCLGIAGRLSSTDDVYGRWHIGFGAAATLFCIALDNIGIFLLFMKRKKNSFRSRLMYSLNLPFLLASCACFQCVIRSKNFEKFLPSFTYTTGLSVLNFFVTALLLFDHFYKMAYKSGN